MLVKCLSRLCSEARKRGLRYASQLPNDAHVSASVDSVGSEGRVDVNAFVTRTHTCGQLSALDVGQRVRLCGWIQYQRMGKFVILRDAYGLTQLITDGKQLARKLSKLMPESVVEVVGRVVRRPLKDVNPALSTGEVEVFVDEAKVWNDCRHDMPYVLRDHQIVNEKTRLEYRYIDIRTNKMQNNLRLRSRVIMNIRKFLIDNYGFVEVETPTLFKRTATGAQEFIVPTTFANNFYSLVQSPQQLKQLLMIGGIDHYFQIARCYRDEGTKSDRQPEFTQLDLEMSFTTANGIMSLIEELIQSCWPNNQSISTPFNRLKYVDAMRYYGSDKPDLRSDIKLQEIEVDFPNDIIDDMTDSCCVALVIPNGNKELDNNIKDIIDELPKIQHEVNFSGKLFHSNISEQLYWTTSEDIPIILRGKIQEKIQLNENDFLWIASGERYQVYRLMGKIRANCVKAMAKLNEAQTGIQKLSFTWVVDFPLFVFKDDNSDELESSHHPFTAPKSEDSELVYTNPIAALGEHFDLVINGQEVGGGSMRIHDSRLQEFVFKDVLKQEVDSMRYFLDALRSGCPPHGGIALGLDRLLSIMCDSASIRDVIAFPKSADGKDLMSGAPDPIPDELKKLYHICERKL